MTLLDPQVWTGRCHDGSWVVPLGGEYPVVEPATGAELGRLGLAYVDDVQRAGARAAEAQKDWAATSYEERARSYGGRATCGGSVPPTSTSGSSARPARSHRRRRSRPTARPTSATRRRPWPRSPTGACCPRPPRG